MKLAEFLRLAGGIFESEASWKQIKSSQKKTLFWDFYTQADGAFGIYCGAPLLELIKKNQYSIEHIIPKSYLYDALDMQPARLRNGATINPFNLAPAHRTLNRIRGDAPFDFDGDPIAKRFQVQFKSVHQDAIGFDDQGEWIPPRKSHGDLARAILYMSLCYSLRFHSSTELEHLRRWAKSDCPSRLEVQYSKWIDKKMGINNPFSRFPELIDDDELMSTLI